MKIHIVSNLVNALLTAAVARAKSYKGRDKTEMFGQALIKYKDGVATVIPMQRYSVSAATPNPVPYRGVSIITMPAKVAQVGIHVRTSEGDTSPYAYTTYRAYMRTVTPGTLGGGAGGTFEVLIASSSGDETVLGTYGGVQGYFSGLTGAQAVYNGQPFGFYYPTGTNSDSIAFQSGELYQAGGFWYVRAYSTFTNAQYYGSETDPANIYASTQTASARATAQAAADAFNAAPDAKAHIIIETSDRQILASGLQTDGPPTYTVPEDVLYPVTSDAAFRLRRKLWLKKNSDAFVADAAGGFKTSGVPQALVYLIRKAARNSAYVGRATPLTVVVGADAISDTTAGLSVPGTKTTTRRVDMRYTDAGGALQTWGVDGTLVQVVSQYAAGADVNGTHLAALQRKDTYTNFWSKSHDDAVYQDAFGGELYWEFPLGHGAGTNELLLNGVEQQGYAADSTHSTPATPAAIVYTPALPAYSTTVAGSIPAFMRKYLTTIPPVLKTTMYPSATEDLALYNVAAVTLRMFGPVTSSGEQLGMFASSADAAGCTSIMYLGALTINIDWVAGAYTFGGWAAASSTTAVPLPPGVYCIDYGGTLAFVTTLKPTVLDGGMAVVAAAAADGKALGSVNDEVATAVATTCSTTVKNYAAMVGVTATATTTAPVRDGVRAAIVAAADKLATATSATAYKNILTSVVFVALQPALAAVAAIAVAEAAGRTPSITILPADVLSSTLLGVCQLTAMNCVMQYKNTAGKAQWPDVATDTQTDINRMALLDPLRALVLTL